MKDMEQDEGGGEEANLKQSREAYLLKIIRESYLFLDFSDCIDNRRSYDRFMRHEVVKG